MKRPLPWLVVLVALLAIGEGLGALLVAQGQGGLGEAVRAAGRLAAGAWVLWGLHVWRDVPWVAKLRTAIAGLVVAAAVAAVSWALEWRSMVYIVGGVTGMAATFFVGLWLVRLALSPGSATIGVARTVLDEAIRMRLPVVFIVGVILVVPVLPFVLDPADRLEYRLRSFLSWSTTAVSLLLSLMTIFLAIGTLTRELERRQVFLSLTKPVKRWQYLAGKWLGIAGLNLVLAATAGVGVYAFTLLVADQPARDAQDRAAVEQRVLVAREARSPVPADPAYFQRAFRERVELLRKNDPGRYGEGAGPIPRERERDIRQALVNEWFTVAPRNAKTFVFTDLLEAKRQSDEVQLRIEPKSASGTPTRTVRLMMRLNGRPYMPYGEPWVELATDTPHTLWVPTDAVDEEGVVRLEMFNPPLSENMDQSTISFNPEDGLQMLARVGGFAPNLARSMALLWIRLGFLAMLGLAASTFLGFPVAALLCTMVLMAASGGSFLTESIDRYSVSPRDVDTTWGLIVWYPTTFFSLLFEGDLERAIKLLISLVGEGFMALIPSFADYSGGEMLSDGRVVSYGLLGEAVGKVGVLWGGVAAAVGYAIFRRKELAKITV